MLFLVQVIVMALPFISQEEHGSIAQFVPPYTSIVAPVTKHTDAAKPLFSVQIMTTYVNLQYLHANFLIDIDAPFIWHDCILQWNIHPGSCPTNTLCTFPVSCEEYQCTDTRTTYSYQNPSCPAHRRRSINVPENITTKLSTIEPYTTLRTDIYNRVVRTFWMATIGIPRVTSVAPFGLCVRTFSNRVLQWVPDIDFGLPDGKKWTVTSANSMKQISRDVACLAFVDGGETLRHL
ncbi:hypothetical protein LXL04_003169 [Taraxacum kok-saghyz]